MRFVLFVSLALFALPIQAQQSTAKILGNVFDPSPAAIGGATITVTNIATSQRRTVQTTAEGEYTISQLPIGEYTMLVEVAGFPSKSIRGIVLQVDQEARLDVNMTLGSTNETIT